MINEDGQRDAFRRRSWAQLHFFCNLGSGLIICALTYAYMQQRALAQKALGQLAAYDSARTHVDDERIGMVAPRRRLMALGTEMSLEALFRRYGTDKQASYHSYVHAYSMLLGPWRADVESMLEVGIGTLNHSFAANMGLRSGYTQAASITSWRQYLPDARIVALDRDADAARAVSNPPQRIEAYGVDTTDERAISALDLTSGGKRPFDVIIDDGLHTWSGQQATLRNLWPLLREGGFYFIEDVVWGDLTKHASAGSSNPLMRSTSPEALAILREGGAYAIQLDAFWSTLSKHRYSTIIALQKPMSDWPQLINENKGIMRRMRAPQKGA